MFLQELPTCFFTHVHLAIAVASKTPAWAPPFAHPVTLIAHLIFSASVTEKVIYYSILSSYAFIFQFCN